MAVYTKLSNNEIADFLLHYRVGELTHARGITEGIDNTNYQVIATLGHQSQNYILTLFERRISQHDLTFFLNLTEWLHARGIACPRTIKGNDGGIFYTLKGKPAALIQFMEGKNNPDITTAHMKLVGELAARMHLAADGFTQTRRNPLSVEGWQAMFSCFTGRSDEISPGLEQEIASELEFLRVHWPSGLPRGVVHTDLFPDNIFFKNDGLGHPAITGVIDFYFACNDFWLYDLAICMNAWCFDSEHRFIKERAQAMFAAYMRLRPLTDSEKLALPVLARGACMRFLVTRAYDWLNQRSGAMVVPKKPTEYVAKLRFHQQVKDCNEYGLGN